MDTSDDTTKASVNAASIASVEGNSQIEWPPSLQGYVGRAFAQCKTDVARNEVEAQLKNIIRDAVASKKLHTLDWALYPLPKISSIPLPEKPKPDTSSKKSVYYLYRKVIQKRNKEKSDLRLIFKSPRVTLETLATQHRQTMKIARLIGMRF